MYDGQDSLSMGYLEGLYQTYLQDANLVSEEWRRYFADHALVQRPHVEPRTEPGTASPADAFTAVEDAATRDELRLARVQECADLLIRNYRARGHMAARIDPLGGRRPRPPELDPEHHGLSAAAVDLPCSTRTLRGANTQTLREVLQRLEESYCGAIGVQFMHIDDLEARDWLQRRMENSENRLRLTRDHQVRILTKLTDAVLFEEFVRTKYVGMKSFSLEGAETLIPLLDLAIEKLALQGTREIVMSMSHRGRLNVLANVIGKSFQAIFREFEDVDAELFKNRGDVKYHLGYHNYFATASGREVHVSLGFNPSHLEFVNPVALGRCPRQAGSVRRFAAQGRRGGADSRRRGVRGRGRRAGDAEPEPVAALRVWRGDSHSGQQPDRFHHAARGGPFSAVTRREVAKMLQIPIFHVNGEDPEAVAQVVELALDFRAAFRRDVVIDMYCFRRLGHNEGDEPAFTQPQMVRAIEQRSTVREGYLERLLEMGNVTRADADEIARRRQETLEHELSLARSSVTTCRNRARWSRCGRATWARKNASSRTSRRASTASSSLIASNG